MKGRPRAPGLESSGAAAAAVAPRVATRGGRRCRLGQVLALAAGLALAAAVAFAGLSSFHRINGRGTDYNVFFAAGTAVLEGRGAELYTLHAPRGPTWRYKNPPLLAIVMAPLAAFTHPVSSTASRHGPCGARSQLRSPAASSPPR